MWNIVCFHRVWKSYEKSRSELRIFEFSRFWETFLHIFKHCAFAQCLKISQTGQNDVFLILAFSTNFRLFKIDLSGNTITLFDCKVQVFKNLPKLIILSTQNVKVARFARNVEWDFFYDFQTLCLCLYRFDAIDVKYNLENKQKCNRFSCFNTTIKAKQTWRCIFVTHKTPVDRSPFFPTPPNTLSLSVCTVFENHRKSLIQ